MQRPLLRQTACLEPENSDVDGTVSFERSLFGDDGWICRREGPHGFGVNAVEKKKPTPSECVGFFFIYRSAADSSRYTAVSEQLTAGLFWPASDPFFLVLQLR